MLDVQPLPRHTCHDFDPALRSVAGTTVHHDPRLREAMTRGVGGTANTNHKALWSALPIRISAAQARGNNTP